MYRKLKHLFNLAPQHGFEVMPFGGTSAIASAEMDPVVNPPQADSASSVSK